MVVMRYNFYSCASLKLFLIAISYKITATAYISSYTVSKITIYMRYVSSGLVLADRPDKPGTCGHFIYSVAEKPKGRLTYSDQS